MKPEVGTYWVSFDHNGKPDREVIVTKLDSTWVHFRILNDGDHGFDKFYCWDKPRGYDGYHYEPLPHAQMIVRYPELLCPQCEMMAKFGSDYLCQKCRYGV